MVLGHAKPLSQILLPDKAEYLIMYKSFPSVLNISDAEDKALI